MIAIRYGFSLGGTMGPGMADPVIVLYSLLGNRSKKNRLEFGLWRSPFDRRQARRNSDQHSAEASELAAAELLPHIHRWDGRWRGSGAFSAARAAADHSPGGIPLRAG